MPYRIALVGILVVGALYLVVLRPKSETVPTPAVPAAQAPGVKGLTTAVDKARGAAATPAAGAATTPATTPTTTVTTTPATPNPAPTATAAAKPAVPATSQDPSDAILAAVDRGHTAVVLFAGPKASDDRAVRRAAQGIDRRGGKVDLHVVSIRRVGAYEAITRGVQVLQAPTILVIGSRRTARTLVGYTTTSEIDQLVADVRRG